MVSYKTEEHKCRHAFTFGGLQLHVLALQVMVILLVRMQLSLPLVHVSRALLQSVRQPYVVVLQRGELDLPLLGVGGTVDIAHVSRHVSPHVSRRVDLPLCKRQLESVVLVLELTFHGARGKVCGGGRVLDVSGLRLVLGALAGLRKIHNKHPSHALMSSKYRTCGVLSAVFLSELLSSVLEAGESCSPRALMLGAGIGPLGTPAAPGPIEAGGSTRSCRLSGAGEGPAPGLGEAFPGAPAPRPARVVTGEAFALVTGVAWFAVPLVVALAAA